MNTATDNRRSIYVSGPMAGIPEHNFPAFRAIAGMLREDGWNVVSPAEINEDAVAEGISREVCLRNDFRKLVECQAIYMLPGWHNSRGANVEFDMAEAMGLETHFAPGAMQGDSAHPIARSINKFVAAAHGAAFDAGWWTDPSTGMDLKQVINHPQNALEKRFGKALFAEKLMLKVSEVAEAMEGHRKNLNDDKLPDLPMWLVEFGDTVIRIGDTTGAMEGADLGTAVVRKMAFNKVRPDHKLENRKAEGGKAY